MPRTRLVTTASIWSLVMWRASAVWTIDSWQAPRYEAVAAVGHGGLGLGADDAPEVSAALCDEREDAVESPRAAFLNAPTTSRVVFEELERATQRRG